MTKFLRKYIILFLMLITISFSNDKGITGKATYYSSKFEGRRTATGDIFRQSKFTGASNFFRLGTQVLITNVNTGDTVTVLINDRTAISTARKGVIVDLTVAAAKQIGIYKYGSGRVTVEEI